MRARYTGILSLGLAVWMFGAAGEAAAQSWPDLSEPAALDGGGEKDAALIVGVEDYVFAPDVEGAVQNANDWYVFLTRGRKIPVGNVILLRDAQGTRESLLEQAAAVTKRVGRGGTLWFIYIGHGAPSKDGKDGVLVGADAQQAAASLYARSVRKQELLDLFEKGKQARTVALLDACFSGRSASGDVLVAGLQPLIPVEDQGGDALVLTAGASDEFAGPLPDAHRPAFSYLALGALRGWGDANADGKVSGREVVDYSRDALRVILRDRAQTPALTGDGQDEPLVSGAAETAPDLTRIVLGKSGDDDRGGADGAGPGANPTGDPPGGVVQPATPSSNTGLGLVRVGFGLGFYGADTLNVTTSDTQVKHNSNTIFDTFPLDISGATDAVSPLGVNASLVLGQEGVGIGTSLGLAWLSSPAIAVRVSTPSDGFSEEVTDLTGGVDGTITSYLRLNATADLLYRLALGDLSFYASAGAGVGVTFLDLEFKVDNLDNAVSTTALELLIPLQTGVDYNVYKNIFAHLDYTFFASPTGSQSVQGGLGFYY